MAEDEAEAFARDVTACVKALNEQLPQLAARHTGVVLLAAMAEHIGGALHILMRDGDCTPERARQLLADLEALVFAEGLSAPSRAESPPNAAKGK